MIAVLNSCCTVQNRLLCILCVLCILCILCILRDAPWTASQHRALVFPQGMYHHALLYSRALIGFASLLFYPILVGEFSSFHIHVVSISPAGDVIWHMINAVHLFSIANQIVTLVFVWKELCTSANEPVEDNLIKDYVSYAFYVFYTIYAYYAMTYCLPSASRSFKSSSSLAGNRLRYRWYHDKSWTVISTIIGDGSEIRPRGFAKLYSSTSSVRRPSRRKGIRSRTWRISIALTRDGGLLWYFKCRNRPDR